MVLQRKPTAKFPLNFLSDLLRVDLVKLQKKIQTMGDKLAKGEEELETVMSELNRKRRSCSSARNYCLENWTEM